MKKILCFAFSIVLVIALASTAFAQSYTSYPEWFPEDVSNFQNFHGQNLPLVVDNAGILSEEEEAELSLIAERIVSVSGFGYVILTDTTSCGASLDLYAADFVVFNGYGKGNNYSATVFFLCLEEGNRGWRTIGVNDCAVFFDSATTYQIDELVDSDMRSGRYFEALKKQALFIEEYFLNPINKQSDDKIPSDYSANDYQIRRKSSKSTPILPFVIMGLVLGLIIAAVSGKKMVNAMVLKTSSSAASYLVPGSLNIKNTNVIYLYTNVVKTRRADDSGRGGHSGGGHSGSSHSSGHSSSGSHYSGGGRNF